MMRRLWTMRRASRLHETGRPVRASNTATPTGVVSTTVSRSARAWRSSRQVRALAMALAVCEANGRSTSSSSPVNSSPPAFSTRQELPACTPRWRIGVPWKVLDGWRSEAKPSERTWAGTSARRSGARRSGKCRKRRGPSGHSSSRRCASPAKPEVTESRGAPVSSRAAMAPWRAGQSGRCRRPRPGRCRRRSARRGGPPWAAWSSAGPAGAPRGAELDAGRCGRAPGSEDTRRFAAAFIFPYRDDASV